MVTVDQPQYSVITGQTITLGCTVTSSPTHTTVLWQRTSNGVTNNIVINNNKYQGATVNNPDLTITNTDSNDQATYTCSATNIVGTGTSTTTTLVVTGSKEQTHPSSYSVFSFRKSCSDIVQYRNHYHWENLVLCVSMHYTLPWYIYCHWRWAVVVWSFICKALKFSNIIVEVV